MGTSTSAPYAALNIQGKLARAAIATDGESGQLAATDIIARIALRMPEPTGPAANHSGSPASKSLRNRGGNPTTSRNSLRIAPIGWNLATAYPCRPRWKPRRHVAVLAELVGLPYAVSEVENFLANAPHGKVSPSASTQPVSYTHLRA